jgi:hypothetical protein
MIIVSDVEIIKLNHLKFLDEEIRRLEKIIKSLTKGVK